MAVKTTLRHRVGDEVFTRTTAREYTHVVVGSDTTCSQEKYRFENKVISWHGSEAAAAKGMASAASWASALRVEAINGGEES